MEKLQSHNYKSKHMRGCMNFMFVLKVYVNESPYIRGYMTMAIDGA